MVASLCKSDVSEIREAVFRANELAKYRELHVSPAMYVRLCELGNGMGITGTLTVFLGMSLVSDAALADDDILVVTKGATTVKWRNAVG